MADRTAHVTAPADDRGGVGDPNVRLMALAQKMEAIGQLMPGVAHELNNPLAAITGFSQIIGSDPSVPDDLRQSASLLVSEADRTRRIVQNLLDFARQRPPERHPTHLRPLIDSVVELSSYGIGTAQVEVAVDVPDELPPVALDRQQMQQVLLNLLTNSVQAIRSTGRSGHVSFSARASRLDDAPAVRLNVTDDGPGIPAAQRRRLFVPFFTTKPAGEGTGLGLSVSYGIVAAHGGELSFEEPPEGGARFVLELPLTSGDDRIEPELRVAARVPEAGASEKTAIGDGPAIVVLDDEPAIRAFLGKALRGAGYGPIVVADGPAALAVVHDRDDVAAMLCDFRMAGMSGTEVFEAVVAERPALAQRFVFMSGDVLDPELRTFADEHGVRLLAKPFDIETVARIVADTVGMAREDAPGN